MTAVYELPVGSDVENGQPPQDEAAEQAVLGAMLLSSNAITDVVGLLGRDDFYEPRHQIVFDVITDLHERGVDVDAVTVGIELGRRRKVRESGGAPYLHTLIEPATVPSPASASFYAKSVAEKAVLRRLAQTATRLTEYAYAGAEGDDVAAVLDKAQNELQVLVDGHTSPGRSGELYQLDGENPPGWHGRPGGGFIFDRPDGIPALWGEGDQVVWAKSESLMIVAHPGVGKTTMAGLVLRAQLGLTDEPVLGLPVPEAECDKILYLAMDRPAQIARSLARQFSADYREVLDERLIIRDGPPPADLAKNPGLLTKMAEFYGAGIVYIDSLKDAALGLSDDEVSTGYNSARQHLLHNGGQLLELHHPRKSWDGKTDPTLNDVYGGMWITAGAGSVLMVGGVAGDPLVRVFHLKQPGAEILPFDVEIDESTGEMRVDHDQAVDVLAMARDAGPEGLTSQTLAKAMYGPKPTPAQTKKALRLLVRKEKEGLLVSKDGQRGGSGGSQAKVWFLG